MVLRWYGSPRYLGGGGFFFFFRPIFSFLAFPPSSVLPQGVEMAEVEAEAVPTRPRPLHYIVRWY